MSQSPPISSSSLDDDDSPASREAGDLQSRAKLALLEARTVLPGVQTLFGFQLAVVFTDIFQNNSSFSDQCVHMASIGFVALTIVTLLLPAAYHRYVEPGQVSEYFIELTTHCIRFSMGTLACALSLSLYLVVDTVVHRVLWSAVAGAITASVLIGAWFLFPAWMLWRRRRLGRS